jgi:dipeptidyl aminopeptidase/acylaminoacyl peptidase
MSQDHQHWLIAYYLDDAPLEYFHYDRGRRRARRLFSLTPALEGAPLVKMEPVAIRARDGLELISYLRRPRGSSPADRLPMVLLVHGGPCGRDVCAFEIHAASQASPTCTPARSSCNGPLGSTAAVWGRPSKA